MWPCSWVACFLPPCGSLSCVLLACRSSPWARVRFSTDVVFTTPDLFYNLFFYLLLSVADYLFSSCTGLDSLGSATSLCRSGDGRVWVADVDEVLWSTYPPYLVASIWTAVDSLCFMLVGKPEPHFSCRRRRRHETRIPRARTILPSFALHFFQSLSLLRAPTGASGSSRRSQAHLPTRVWCTRPNSPSRFEQPHSSRRHALRSSH